jgi:hypothetical protein
MLILLSIFGTYLTFALNAKGDLQTSTNTTTFVFNTCPVLPNTSSTAGTTTSENNGNSSLPNLAHLFGNFSAMTVVLTGTTRQVTPSQLHLSLSLTGAHWDLRRSLQ